MVQKRVAGATEENKKGSQGRVIKVEGRLHKDLKEGRE